MIKISGRIIEPNSIINQYPPYSIERKIIIKMSSSDEIYEYDLLNDLSFELNLRKNIVTAAIELYRSNMSFKTFRKSICNPDYWDRTNEGGFLLQAGVKPSDAINDIFINGSKYGTECATAIIIIYYKALLGIYPEKLYNKLFQDIQLMDWQYIDNNLDIGYYTNEVDFFPGDCRYFKNPDVNPLTPEWQGENTIDLSKELYYGHGIGIGTSTVIINVLNRYRKDGSTESAYLLDSATRPNFKHLSDIYYDYVSRSQVSNYIMG